MSLDEIHDLSLVLLGVLLVRVGIIPSAAVWIGRIAGALHDGRVGRALVSRWASSELSS